MSEMTSLERDTQSRDRIVSDIDTNFFVEAGAGSGKTTMLVSRMVTMVEAGIPIEKICAITFTKAAAGEFYERFQKLLIERSNPEHVWVDKGYAGQLPEPTDETRELCAEALKNIDLCFMGTIDSFCGMILSEHPSEAGIPSDAAIVSDGEAEVFYKQMYVKICAGDFDDAVPGLSGMADSFRGFYRDAENVFVQGESVFMDNRNVHFNYNKPEAVDINNAFAEDREAVLRALKCLLEHPELAYPEKKDNQAAWERIDDTYKSLSREWSSNFSGVLYALKSFKNLRVIPEAKERYERELAGVFEPHGEKKAKWFDCTVGDEDGLLSKLKGLRYSVSMAFLEACVPVLESAMRDKGSMTYFDYLYYLRNMLRRDAEGDGRLIRYIYDRHSYFLIDEFQDTNPMQAEVFFYLSSEHPDPRWSACRPRPGSLFIVGDPKQSIYRFRSADVSSFLKVRGLFEKNGGAILSLSRNFRSTSTLCEYFNRCFTEMLPEETEHQSRFEEIPVPDAKDDEFQGIYTYRAYTGKLEAEHPGETDPGQVAKIIDRLVGREEFLIRGGEDDAPRKLRYSDIMVITYGKKKLGPIMAKLDERGIPTKVEGEVPFGSNEALSEIYKIFAAVADADDAISLYGALTGKLIGLTKEEILAYRVQGGRMSLNSSFNSDACEDEAACLVASRIEELKSLHREAMRLSPAALFAAILDGFRAYEVVAAENLEVLYYALELIRNAEKSRSVVSLKDGAAYLAELLDGVSGEERCLSLNNGTDAVHMANLHKVKGLEAPVVILAAATSFTNRSEKRIVHGDDGAEGYLFSLSQKAGYMKYFETGEFTEEYEEEMSAVLAEGRRLIYVAATRARNALIICDSITTAFGMEARKSAWNPIMRDGLHDFFEATGEYVPHASGTKDAAAAAELYDEAERACVLNDRSVEASTYKGENPSRLRLTSRMAEEQAVNTIEESLSGGAPDINNNAAKSGDRIVDCEIPALLGTMVHKLMEMLVTAKNMIDVAGAVGEIIKEYRTPAFESCEKELTAALTGVAGRMKDGGYAQTNGLPQDMLGTLLGAEEVYCEVPFCYFEDGEEGRTVWNGIMDVVYYSQGKWHIVDYKTNADGCDLDKKYQAQLSAYVKAFKATTGEDADALTYHIDI